MRVGEEATVLGKKRSSTAPKPKTPAGQLLDQGREGHAARFVKTDDTLDRTTHWIRQLTVGGEAAAAQAAQIGTHVLVDAANLDQHRTTATWRVHRPIKDPNNPILREDKPWEDRLHMFGSVVHASDGDDKILRIYYLVDGQFGIYNCVVESRDGGLSFVKPSLGLVPWGKAANVSVTTANNIVGTDIKLVGSD
jgi:hypothetical protein